MLNNIAKYYSFLIVSIMTLGGFISSNTIEQLIAAMLFYPLSVYFLFEITPRRKKALELEVVTPRIKKRIKRVEKEVPISLELEDESVERDLDADRRAFLKLIGSAGLSVFMLSLFTKRAEAAFFGSVPGPGTVALKDSSGNQIDPAIKHPTDGYRLAQLDDSTTSYYGFTNKDGAWFIIQEDSSGNFRYINGSSGFSSNWTNRAALSYDYYENVF